MSFHNHRRIIATAAVLATGVAPAAAQASDIGAGGGEAPLPAPHIVAPAHPGSTDWALIALAGGGTAVLVGAGVGGSRRITRRRESAARAQAPHRA
jgi:hypothetical protein